MPGQPLMSLHVPCSCLTPPQSLSPSMVTLRRELSPRSRLRQKQGRVSKRSGVWLERAGLVDGVLVFKGLAVPSSLPPRRITPNTATKHFWSSCGETECWCMPVEGLAVRGEGGI
ncbi:hypothetical protein E2C01_075643 [Portunus trituberculatus]|uniref:Uncharacterized protein n=1 Tax=Portunus trituberculatus TaxID=210409 RepID=A0A5B7IFH8_PORTR|nr:hypothetical protein [Portunus trituberculatus]